MADLSHIQKGYELFYSWVITELTKYEPIFSDEQFRLNMATPQFYMLVVKDLLEVDKFTQHTDKEMYQFFVQLWTNKSLPYLKLKE